MKTRRHAFVDGRFGIPGDQGIEGQPGHCPLLYDNVNPCNGLCPVNTSRNLSAFYYQVFRFPEAVRSRPCSVQFLTACDETKLAKHGVGPILSVIESELRHYTYNGEKRNKKVFAFTFTGDSKALHRVCGQRCYLQEADVFVSY
eukprot:Rmarinus@m.6267